MEDKTPIECVCSQYNQESFKSAFSDEIVHCYECGAYNDGIEKGRQEVIKEIENERFETPQYIAESGSTPVIICLTEIDLQTLKGGKDV